MYKLFKSLGDTKPHLEEARPPSSLPEAVTGLMVFCSEILSCCSGSVCVTLHAIPCTEAMVILYDDNV